MLARPYLEASSATRSQVLVSPGIVATEQNTIILRALGLVSAKKGFIPLRVGSGEAYVYVGEATNTRPQFSAITVPPLQRSLPFDSSLMSPEMEWVEKNHNTLRAYAGEWVVLSGDGVLAHGRDYRGVRARATSARIRTPFIFRVPESDAEVFMGL